MWTTILVPQWFIHKLTNEPRSAVRWGNTGMDRRRRCGAVVVRAEAGRLTESACEVLVDVGRDVAGEVRHQHAPVTHVLPAGRCIFILTITLSLTILLLLLLLVTICVTTITWSCWRHRHDLSRDAMTTSWLQRDVTTQWRRVRPSRVIASLCHSFTLNSQHTSTCTYHQHRTLSIWLACRSAGTGADHTSVRYHSQSSTENSFENLSSCSGECWRPRSDDFRLMFKVRSLPYCAL